MIFIKTFSSFIIKPKTLQMLDLIIWENCLTLEWILFLKIKKSTPFNKITSWICNLNKISLKRTGQMMTKKYSYGWWVNGLPSIKETLNLLYINSTLFYRAMLIGIQLQTWCQEEMPLNVNRSGFKCLNFPYNKLLGPYLKMTF